MLQISGDAKYADVMETALYNSVLSGISLDGKKFLYTNPLSYSDNLPFKQRWSKDRVPYISLSNCCPPNVVRTISEINNYAYSTAKNGLFINLYGTNSLNTQLQNGEQIAKIHGIEYGASPTEIKIVDEDTATPKEQFNIMATELWFAAALLLGTTTWSPARHAPARWVAAGLLAMATASLSLPSGSGWEDALPAHQGWGLMLGGSCLLGFWAVDQLAARLLVERGSAAVAHYRSHRPGIQQHLDADLSLAEMVTRALRQALSRARADLERGQVFLASIGSVAHFVGLVGTLWGIYHALLSISQSGQATLDKVAGPVVEMSMSLQNLNRNQVKLAQICETHCTIS
jgi:hypothetical protein